MSSKSRFSPVCSNLWQKEWAETCWQVKVFSMFLCPFKYSASILTSKDSASPWHMGPDFYNVQPNCPLLYKKWKESSALPWGLASLTLKCKNPSTQFSVKPTKASSMDARFMDNKSATILPSVPYYSKVEATPYMPIYKPKLIWASILPVVSTMDLSMYPFMQINQMKLRSGLRHLRANCQVLWLDRESLHWLRNRITLMKRICFWESFSGEVKRRRIKYLSTTITSTVRLLSWSQIQTWVNWTR